MASVKIELRDLLSKDKRRGVQIHLVPGDWPKPMKMQGEPCCTPAQAVYVAMIEAARQTCDALGLVIEETQTGGSEAMSIHKITRGEDQAPAPVPVEKPVVVTEPVLEESVEENSPEIAVVEDDKSQAAAMLAEENRTDEPPESQDAEQEEDERQRDGHPASDSYGDDQDDPLPEGAKPQYPLPPMEQEDDE